MPLRLLAVLLVAFSCSSCRQSEPSARGLTVAAAANLTGAMDEVAAAFTKQSGAQVRLSYGSTAQLAQQIQNGAPFDVFAAADTEHGRAAIEALKAAGVWDKTQAKIVYANNVNMARQYAASGNANAALTAYSLVMKDSGTVMKVDPNLHQPIEQAAAVIANTQQAKLARDFLRFLKGRTGREILTNRGYLVP